MHKLRFARVAGLKKQAIHGKIKNGESCALFSN
jgi:hypothetical protein